MSHNYIFLEKAQQEYESSVKWYAERSVVAAENFVTAIENCLHLICSKPDWWRNQYKDFYELALKKYPFTIIYLVDTANKQIIVTSVYHHKRNPAGKYKKRKQK